MFYSILLACVVSEEVTCDSYLCSSIGRIINPLASFTSFSLSLVFCSSTVFLCLSLSSFSLSFFFLLPSFPSFLFFCGQGMYNDKVHQIFQLGKKIHHFYLTVNWENLSILNTLYLNCHIPAGRSCHLIKQLRWKKNFM